MKPKVAIIGLKGLPAFGGAASVGQALIDEIKSEYDFYVYSLSTHTNKEGSYNGFTQIVFKEGKVNGFTTFKYYFKSLIHCLFLSRYDIVHLHHAESGFITPFLRIKYKVIVTFHGVYTNKIDPKFNNYVNMFFRFSERMNIKFANEVISVSSSDKEYCEKKYGRRINYIPNGVNKPELKNSDKPYDFLFIAARIYEIKGLHLLLRAMGEYKIPGKLIVIGDLNQSIQYKEYVLCLADNIDVEFIPLIKDKVKLFEYISESKIFIFPSLFEAMSMTLLEVVSLKVPVLASNIIANKNIFNESDINYFDSENFNDLAEKLLFCINNEKVIMEKAERAYEKVCTYYAWDFIANSYKKIYNKYLGVN